MNRRSRIRHAVRDSAGGPTCRNRVASADDSEAQTISDFSFQL